MGKHRLIWVMALLLALGMAGWARIPAGVAEARLIGSFMITGFVAQQQQDTGCS